MLQFLAASMLMIAPQDSLTAQRSVIDSTRNATIASDSFVARTASLAMPQAVALTMPEDTTPRRRAITYSDWYGRRLMVHRIGSYTMLPLFVGQYLLGSELLKQKKGTFDGSRLVPVSENLLTSHKVVAGTIATVFVVNGFTGAWNLYASRKDPAHRKLRYVHALLMASSEAGFIVTGIAAKNAVNRRVVDANKHRNYALGSMAIATTGVTLMWFGNRH